MKDSIKSAKLLIKNSEYVIQRNVMRYIKANEDTYPALKGWYHVPNGGHRSGREAIKFVNMGVRKGVPDLMHPGVRVPMHTHPHLLCVRAYAIECKSKAGKLSPEQEWWKAFLINLGYEYLSSCDEFEIKEWIKRHFMFSVSP